MCTDCISRRGFLALIPAVAVLASCGKETGPASVRWGKESCDYCGMLVDDPRFAAQVRGGPKRKVWKFDDLGDGVLWLAKQPFADDPDTEFWVGDCEKGTWIDGKTAWYLPGKKSPMAHNYGAVSERRDGALTFPELRAKVLAAGAPSNCETRS